MPFCLCRPPGSAQHSLSRRGRGLTRAQPLVPRRGAGAALGAEWDPCWLEGTMMEFFTAVALLSCLLTLFSKELQLGSQVLLGNRDQDEKWLQGCFRKGLF